MSYVISQIIDVLEKDAPLQLQESYDNSGLILGSRSQIVSKAIITLDVTEEVVKEAIETESNLIISHHPLIFDGIKRITDNTEKERILIDAIKNNIAVYSIHTNIDNSITGMNKLICDKLSLVNTKILRPMKDSLRKLVVFCPKEHAAKLRDAIFAAGAGLIGNYDCCSFNIEGEGTFKGNDQSNPFVGEAGSFHTEEEIRIETVFPAYLGGKLINEMIKAHPYEEVAYDIYPIENEYKMAGAGMIGELVAEMNETDFLEMAKSVFGTPLIKHSGITGMKVRKIAVCGGSGAFLINDAIKAGAGVFISADLKYHQFQEAEKRILITDVGHYESEQFIKSHLLNILKKYFPNFAAHSAKRCVNSVKYF